MVRKVLYYQSEQSNFSTIYVYDTDRDTGKGALIRTNVLGMDFDKQQHQSGDYRTPTSHRYNEK